jgi:pilus assembly protein CpaF
MPNNQTPKFWKEDPLEEPQKPAENDAPEPTGLTGGSGSPLNLGSTSLFPEGQTGYTAPVEGYTGTPLSSQSVSMEALTVISGTLEPTKTKTNFAFFGDADSTSNTLAPEVTAKIENEVIDVINRDFDPQTLQRPSDDDRIRVGERVSILVSQCIRKMNLNPGSGTESTLTSDLARRILGLGFLDLLLPPLRNDVTEIAVYSNGLVQVMLKGDVRWTTVPVRPSSEEVQRVLDRILGAQNKSLNETNPTVNAKLARTEANPGGGRVKALHTAIVPPSKNHAINIRLYEQKPVHPAWLLEKKVMSPEMMDSLRLAVEAGKRILICGGTRTGKTTLLSAISNYLPADWRIVKIEDPEEIWIDRETVQTIEARPHVLGTEVLPYTLADGVDDAMRMSPDYLIIGEVRDGRAAMALFRGLMTGHSGSCTLHADNPREAASRLANLMGTDAGVRKADANQMIADAIDMIVQIGIRHEKRVVTDIAMVRKQLKGGEVWFDPIWQYVEASPANNLHWNQFALPIKEEGSN